MYERKLTEDEKWREQQRFLFCTMVIATAVGYLVLFSKKNTFTGFFANLVQIGFFGSGMAAFLYMLATAIQLKYIRPGYTTHLSIPIPEKARVIFYDSCVDVFEYSLIIAVIGSIGSFFRDHLKHHRLEGAILTILVAVFIFGVGNFYFEPRFIKKNRR